MDWLRYYSELRSYKDNMEARFVSLLFQQSVLAFGSTSVTLAIQEKLPAPLFALPIGALTAFALGFYAHLVGKYFKQIREVAVMMATIEKHHLHLEHELSIKHLISGNPDLSIFTRGRTPRGCKLYTGALMFVVIVTPLVPFLVGLVGRAR